jgi:hypothetical protein
LFSDEQAWDVLEDIPNDSAAALILIEHHWAVPLRDAIARAGGFRLSDGFISPLDLVAIGLMAAEEAEELHAMETAAATPSHDGYHHHDLEVRGGNHVRIPQGGPAYRAAHRPTRRPPPLGVAPTSCPRRRDRS